MAYFQVLLGTMFVTSLATRLENSTHFPVAGRPDGTVLLLGAVVPDRKVFQLRMLDIRQFDTGCKNVNDVRGGGLQGKPNQFLEELEYLFY